MEEKSIELLFIEYREMAKPVSLRFHGQKWYQVRSETPLILPIVIVAVAFGLVIALAYLFQVSQALLTDTACGIETRSSRRHNLYICFYLAWIFRLNVKTRTCGLVCCVEAGLVYGRHLGVPACCAHHHQRLHRGYLAVTRSLKGSSGSQYSR